MFILLKENCKFVACWDYKPFINEVKEILIKCGESNIPEDRLLNIFNGNPTQISYWKPIYVLKFFDHGESLEF